MQGKSNQGVVELLLPRDLADINIFHPVVQNLVGNAAKIFKCMNMTIKKGR